MTIILKYDLGRDLVVMDPKFNTNDAHFPQTELMKTGWTDRQQHVYAYNIHIFMFI